MDRNSYKSRKTLSTLLALLASFGVTQGIAAADPVAGEFLIIT